MSLATFALKKALQRALRRTGFHIQRLSEVDRELFARFDNRRPQDLNALYGDRLARLDELRRRYEQVRLPVTAHSLWAGGKPGGAVRAMGWGMVDLRSFRGSAAYVWDYVASNLQAAQLKYYLFADYVRRQDASGLLQGLSEDGAFGCVTFDFPGLGCMSRDLLDSVIELGFLQQHLRVLERDDLRVLDIGAGYGRMAHRMLTANPRVASYTCVDAIAESTFLCEFYLGDRGLAQRVEIVPLDALDATLSAPRFDLALNVHSFSECTYAAIEWWLRRLAQLKVRHLLIVPNHPSGFFSMEADRSLRDYAPLLAEVGYVLTAEAPVLDDTNLQTLVGITDRMYLFELR